MEHFFLSCICYAFVCACLFLLVKTSNCEDLVLYFSEKVQKVAAFAMLFWLSVAKQSFENGFGFPQ